MSSTDVLAAARIIRDGGRLPENCTNHTTYTPGCRPCQQQASLRLRARRKADAYGWLQPAFGDASEAHQHIRRLHNQHRMSYQHIADVAQTSQPTIRRIATGRRTRASHDTIARILAVEPAPPRPLNGTTFIIGTARRLQALAYIRYTPTDLAPMLGADKSDVRRWRAARQPMITLGWRDRIAALADRLATTPGPSPRARAHAVRRSWVPLAAWDDIDDPAARPVPGSLPGEVAELRLSVRLVRAAIAGTIPLAALTDAEQALLFRLWGEREQAAGRTPGQKPFARAFQTTEWLARQIAHRAALLDTETDSNPTQRKVA